MRINKTTLKNQRVIVAYEVARKLYEMGFNEPCIQYYGTTSHILFGSEWNEETTKGVPNDNLSKGIYGVYSAPR